MSSLRSVLDTINKDAKLLEVEAALQLEVLSGIRGDLKIPVPTPTHDPPAAPAIAQLSSVPAASGQQLTSMVVARSDAAPVQHAPVQPAPGVSVTETSAAEMTAAASLARVGLCPDDASPDVIDKDFEAIFGSEAEGGRAGDDDVGDDADGLPLRGDADGLTDQPDRTDASQLPEVSLPPVVSEPPVVTNESNEGGTATPQQSQPAAPKTPPPLAREQVVANAFTATGQSATSTALDSQPQSQAAEPKAGGIPVEIPASGPEPKRARVEQAAVQAAAPGAATARKSEPQKLRRPRAPKAVVGKDGQSGIAKFGSAVTPAPLALQPRPAAAAGRPAAGPMVPPGRVPAPRGRGSGKAQAISAQPASGQAPGPTVRSPTPGRPGSLLKRVFESKHANKKL